jgi:hypothetical protein
MKIKSELIEKIKAFDINTTGRLRQHYRGKTFATDSTDYKNLKDPWNPWHFYWLGNAD